MISHQSHSASTLGLSPEMCRIHENHIEKLRRLYHLHWLKGPGLLRALAQGPWATSDSLGFLPQQSWLIDLLWQRILCLSHLTWAKVSPAYVSTSGPMTAAKRSKCSAKIQLLKIYRSEESVLAWSPLHLVSNKLNLVSFSSPLPASSTTMQDACFPRASCPHSICLQAAQPILYWITCTGHGVPPEVRPDRLRMPFWNAFR